MLIAVGVVAYCILHIAYCVCALSCSVVKGGSYALDYDEVLLEGYYYDRWRLRSSGLLVGALVNKQLINNLWRMEKQCDTTDGSASSRYLHLGPHHHTSSYIIM